MSLWRPGAPARGPARAARLQLGAALALVALLTLGALLALAAVTEPARSATPNPLTFTPLADSYVQADSGSATHGGEVQLRADASPVFRAYLRFDVQGLQGAVTRAVLRVNARSSHSVGYQVRSVADTSWNEGTISFANAPPVGATAVGSSGAFANGAWTEVDVTSLVVGNGLVSLALTTTSTTAMSLASRESGVASRPQLVVTTGSSAPDTAAPTVPSGLSAAADGTNRIALAWSPATDDRGVSGYGIYRDGGTVPIASTIGATATSFTDTGLAAGSSHVYRVDAVDAAGNRSARSAEAGATTSAAPPPSPPGGTTQTLTPVADSYVRADQPGANYGTVTPLRLDGSPVHAAYLRFSVQGLSGPPSRVMLRMRAGSSQSVGYRVSGVASTAWGESTITSGNAPPMGPAGGSSGPVTSGQFSEVDVTPLVAGNGLVSMALTTVSATAMTLSSAEAPAGSRPELVITAAPTPDTSAPSVPAGLTASPGGRTAIALDWTPSADDRAVAGYAIYRDGGLTPIAATTGATATAYTDAGLAPNSSYSYEVDAVDAAGNRSARSAAAGATTLPPDTSPPSVPAGLSAAGARGAIALSWSAASDDDAVAGYAIYRDGGLVPVATTSGPTATSYTDAGLAPNSSYSYEVDAVDAAGNRSARSAAAGATTLPPDTSPPSVPAGLSAAAGGRGAIALSWSAASDDDAVAGYAIYRDGGPLAVATTTGASATGYVDAGLEPGSTHSYEVDAADAAGNRSGRSGPASATTAIADDPVIAAAGDIACDPTVAGFNVNGTATLCRMMATKDLILGIAPSAVLALGDLQYEDGALSKFMGSYDPTWGQLKAITRPAAGNHEYGTAGAAGYFQYFGAAAGDPAKGYYSFDVGSWHLIALNSNCTPAGGCGAGSPQETWLRADLAAHPSACTLAYWHHPRFSSGQHGSLTWTQALWQALYDAGADVVLNGHDHDYERFAPQGPTGSADVRGIREFVVGTGGKNHYAVGAPIANSEARNPSTFGVLKLTLHPTSYDWEFVPEPGGTFTDSGSTPCS